MVAFQPRLTGIFTPSSEAIDELTALKYKRDFKGRVPRSPHEVHADEASKLVQLQRDAGFSLISDGQFSWGDLLRPVYAGTSGVDTGSQTRWFEVNGFVFPPRIVGRPKEAEVSTIADYLYPSIMGPNGEVTLVGPYTMFRMTENETNVPSPLIRYAFSSQFKRVLSNLLPNIRLVEFCEPALSYDARHSISKNEMGEALAFARDAYREIASVVPNSVQTIVQLPDGDFNELAQYVIDLPVGGFGVDLTETVTPSSKINLEGRILSAGILNSSSSVPENLPFSAQRVRMAISTWHPDSTYVTTYAQLFHTISHEPAVAKVKELGKLAEMLS